MKAIQIKYLPCTNTKPARLKAWAEGNKPLIRSIQSTSQNTDIQARLLAIDYVQARNWGHVYSFATLPNGDYVATLGE